MNKLLYNYTYLKHGIILGEMTCEELKTTLLDFTDEQKTVVVRGKSLETGLPKSVKVKTTDVKEALLSQINQIIDSIKEIVELAPPEVVDEVFTQGIILTGGMAQVPGIAEFFAKELTMKVKLADDLLYSTIHGLIKIGRRDTIERLRVMLP